MTADRQDTQLLAGALAVLGRHRVGAPGEPLDEALVQIEETLADAEFASWDNGTKAYVWLLAGIAATFRHRSDRSAVDDLDRGVQWLRLAAEVTGAGSFTTHAAAVNLASALNSRYER